MYRLGYTTDNGAFYYYNTEPGKNYEATILDLKAYAVREKIPFRWVLYDSWFYEKGGETGHGWDPLNGVINWTDADPSIFPSGLRYMYRETGWPVVAHNRAWDRNNVYAKQNGGTYSFVLGNTSKGEPLGLPLERRFWDDLLQNAREWGCINYQQDWMFQQQDMAAMLADANLGDTWQHQMDAALVVSPRSHLPFAHTLWWTQLMSPRNQAQENMHFGFGGTTMRNWLMGTEMYSVTNGRISNDYHANLTEQWRVGIPSIFGWALATIPAKDGWWTVPDQPGHPYNDTRSEPYGRLHAAVATFTRGPVSPADRIGYMNRTMIMRSCMDDGTLLSADVPATAIDGQMRHKVFGHGGPAGEVWSSTTTVSGYRFDHILSATLEQPYDLVPADLRYNTSDGDIDLVVFENTNGLTRATAELSTAHPLRLPASGKLDFHVHHTAPLIAGGKWRLLGETAKWMPVSAARVVQIASVGADAEVVVRGTPEEEVTMQFLADGVLLTQRCTVPESGRVAFVAISPASTACRPA